MTKCKTLKEATRLLNALENAFCEVQAADEPIALEIAKLLIAQGYDQPVHPHSLRNREWLKVIQLLGDHVLYDEIGALEPEEPEDTKLPTLSGIRLWRTQPVKKLDKEKCRRLLVHFHECSTERKRAYLLVGHGGEGVRYFSDDDEAKIRENIENGI